MSVTSALLKGLEQNKNVSVNRVPFVIGRCKTADLIIAHLNVSRNHCRILKEDNEWRMFDFSSSGTFINDVLVGKGKSSILKDGDKIRFGPVESKLFWTFEEVKPVECNKNILVQEKKESNSGTEEKDKELRSGKNTQQSKVDNFLKSAAVLGIQSSNLNVLEVEADERDLTKKELENKLTKQEEEKELLIKKLKEMEEIQKKLFEQINGNQKIGCSKEVDVKKEKIDETNETKRADFPNSSNKKEDKNTEPCTAADTNSRVMENFTNLMETELQCTICAELFVTAITLSCSHTFCKHCITQWKKKQKTCPICRKKITNEIRSLVVDNYIDKVVESLSAELKERREAVIEERKETIPAKKRRTAKS